MHVSINVFSNVDLDYPVNRRKINSSSSNVSAKQHSLLFLYELEINGSSFILVLFTVKLKQILAHFKRLKCLIGEPDLLARREKYKAFEFGMRFQKTEQHVQFSVALDYHVVVQQRCWRDLLQLVVTCFPVCSAFHLIEIVNLDVFVVPF